MLSWHNGYQGNPCWPPPRPSPIPASGIHSSEHRPELKKTQLQSVYQPARKAGQQDIYGSQFLLSSFFVCTSLHLLKQPSPPQQYPAHPKLHGRPTMKNLMFLFLCAYSWYASVHTCTRTHTHRVSLTHTVIVWRLGVSQRLVLKLDMVSRLAQLGWVNLLGKSGGVHWSGIVRSLASLSHTSITICYPCQRRSSLAREKLILDWVYRNLSPG